VQIKGQTESSSGDAQSKADRVYETLRTEFVQGEWPFGQTFSGAELAERFGVSRRPVMDAVQRLEADGFVDIIPQVGCRVVLPEEARIRDNLELQAAIETPAARMAAERATPADVELLEAIHAETAAIVEARDADAYPALNREFHALILEIAGNRAFASIAAKAGDLRAFYFHPHRYHEVVDVLPDRQADHERILAAIRAHDPSAAETAMAAHLDPEHGLSIIRRAAERREQTRERSAALAEARARRRVGTRT
jgi:DNA-binding GntR family transcriptional regulator